MVDVRNGSPSFYKLLDEMAEIHHKKSHDYASNNNPYGNYLFAGMLSKLFDNPDDAGFVGRIGEKLYRLANLENAWKAPNNESIEDTEKDICVIVALWMSQRRDRRNSKLVSDKEFNELKEKAQLTDPLSIARSSNCSYCSESMSRGALVELKHGAVVHRNCQLLIESKLDIPREAFKEVILWPELRIKDYIKTQTPEQFINPKKKGTQPITAEPLSKNQHLWLNNQCTKCGIYSTNLSIPSGCNENLLKSHDQ